MALDDIANWLDTTSLSTSLKTDAWIIPTLQSVHILSVCLVFSAAVIVSLRAWNIMGVDWTPQTWARRLYPPQWWALLALLVTGVLQVLAEPTRELPNHFFQFKMLGVLITVPLVLWMTRRFYAHDGSVAISPLVRGISIVVACLWCAIIFAGRWIAYA